MELITGYTKTGVFPEHDADLIAGLVGYNLCVTGVGERMRAEVASSNAVRIFDGVGLAFGREFYIAPGQYDEVLIEGGSDGLKRNDFITLVYQKDAESGEEQMHWGYLKGIESEEAVDPIPDMRDIRIGALQSELPFLRIKYNGQMVEAVEKMYDQLPTFAELVEFMKKVMITE